jgi:UDP-2,3-diacylglucosamine pyrophosphatase LpxH
MADKVEEQKPIVEEKPKAKSEKPKAEPKSEDKPKAEEPKVDEKKVEEVVIGHFHDHSEHGRRQELYDNYWKDKVKDPTDNRHPSEYIPGWWYSHG